MLLITTTILILLFHSIFDFKSSCILSLMNYINLGDISVLSKYIQHVSTDNMSTQLICTICGKMDVFKGNILKHVEAVHFPNMFHHTCTLCGKSARSKGALYKHVSRHHRNSNVWMEDFVIPLVWIFVLRIINWIDFMYCKLSQ